MQSLARTQFIFQYSMCGKVLILSMFTKVCRNPLHALISR